MSDRGGCQYGSTSNNKGHLIRILHSASLCGFIITVPKQTRRAFLLATAAEQVTLCHNTTQPDVSETTTPAAALALTGVHNAPSSDPSPKSALRA